ncbi:hypothetical protein [Streptomyces decoyicus]
MPQRAHNLPVCPACDGFPAVAITTGSRHRDGSRATVQATCPSCKGTGHKLPTAVLATEGRS